MADGPQLTDRKAKLSAARRALLEKRLRGETAVSPAIATISQRPFSGPAPLSHAQERLWFMHQLDPESTAYNMHEAWQLRGPLDVDRLQSAFAQIVQRHETLRTTFHADNGQPMQTIQPQMPVTLAQIDLRSVAQPLAEARRLAEEAAKRPFNLETGPLFYLTLVRLAENHHWLLLTLHHIIADEWSNDILWQELAHFYANPTQPLAPLPIQYADFAHWQTTWLQEGELNKQLAYWKTQLNGRLPILQLPTDHPRPARHSNAGAFFTQTLSADLTSQLKTIGQQAGATPFMTLLAAFTVLLHRYSRQTDILVGTPIANRSRAETKHVIGMFLNTLVMRTQVDDNPPFTTLLDRVRQTALDAYSHQDLPFETVVKTLQPQRDLSHNPLFQAMFVYQNSADSARSLPGLTLDHVPVDGGVSKFDLTLFVSERDGQLEAALEYSTDLFTAATIKRMLTHWEMLLHSIVADPSRPIAQLNLLPEAERQLVTSEWNQTAIDYPKDKTVHQLFEAIVAESGTKTAVRTTDHALTYTQLNERANQLAHHLIAQGVQPDDIVGLCVERSVEMAVGILAILKAGAAYLPLDPGYPADRLAFMLTDAHVKFTIHHSPFTIHHSTQTIDLAQDVSGYPTTNPQTAVSPHNLAYVIYTSGSTGQPKGVLVTHQNLVHSTTARFSFYDRPVERFLLLSSFSFDSSMVGIFWSLCGGGTLCLPPAGVEKEVQQIAQQIAQHQITHLLALPSLYQIILEESDVAQIDSLKTVIVAGEACSAGLVRTHFQTVPGCHLYNEYGPTEGSVWSTATEITAVFTGHTVPIGRPIPNMINLILDDQQQPVPIGVPGELYIGGEGITNGYLNRPELNDLRFTKVDLRETNRQLYRTGDLARWLPDGQIEFLGRVDQQIKIRGFRVELGEIEAVLSSHAGVKETAVQAINTPDGQPQLVAYFVAQSPIRVAELRQFLNGRLPDYMVPAHFVPLDQMPRLPNGKVDRHALPAPHLNHVATDQQRPPRTETEKELVDIWQTILQKEPIGITDNFFALGGHSLLATRIMARLTRQLQVRLPIQTLFDQPTIQEMATAVDEAKQKALPNGPGIKRVQRRAINR